MSTTAEFVARIQGTIPPLLANVAASGGQAAGGGSAGRKYTYSIVGDGFELTYKLRNNDGSYRIEIERDVYKGDMDFVTDLTMTLDEVGEFTGWVYNAEGDDDLEPICYFFSRDPYEDTGGYVVFLAPGAYTPGDPPPFDVYNAFLAARTEP